MGVPLPHRMELCGAELCGVPALEGCWRGVHRLHMGPWPVGSQDGGGPHVEDAPFDAWCG